MVRAGRGDPASHDWYILVPTQSPRHGAVGTAGLAAKAGAALYYGIFWAGMPDLNYSNPAVTAEAERIAEFWLREMGVDGFRLDAIRHLIEDGDVMRHAGDSRLAERFPRYVTAVKPDALTVGEVWTTTETVRSTSPRMSSIASSSSTSRPPSSTPRGPAPRRRSPRRSTTTQPATRPTATRRSSPTTTRTGSRASSAKTRRGSSWRRACC